MMFKIVFDEVFQVAPKDVNFSKIFVDKFFFFFLESCSKLFVVTNTNLSSFAEKVLPSWNNPCPPVVRSPFWLPDFHLVSLVRFCLVGGQSLLHWPVQGGPLNNPPVKLQTPWKSSSPDSVHTRVRAHKPKPMIFCFNQTWEAVHNRWQNLEYVVIFKHFYFVFILLLSTVVSSCVC